MTQNGEAKPMSKPNADELMQDLWDIGKAIKSGDMEPARANAFANVAGKQMALVKLQMDTARQQGTVPRFAMLGVGTVMPDADGQPEA